MTAFAGPGGRRRAHRRGEERRAGLLNVDGLTGRVEVERELVVIVAAAGELALALGSRRREPPPRCTAEKATHEEIVVPDREVLHLHTEVGPAVIAHPTARPDTPPAPEA